MLTIMVGAVEVFNDATQEFDTRGGEQLQLEHSLVSLSKWESKFEKPFLSTEEKTPEELLYYLECMIFPPEQSLELLQKLSEKNVAQINDYIEAKQTATTIGQMPNQPRSRETITSELIYYWMIMFNIPFECETWHLNRLFTLIQVCNIKQAKPKKMSKSEIAARNKELNAQRRAQLGTKG